MWKKADLHHHTSNDISSVRGNLDYKDIINKMSNDFNIIAITNHHKISFDAILEYKKYIDLKSMKIMVLPGIELGFTLDGKAFHLILIFSIDDIDTLKREECNIFKGYEASNNNNYDEVFPKIVRKLKDNKIRFYSMPHFHKGNNKKSFNQKRHPRDFYYYIMGHDLLEGKFIKENDVKKVKDQVKSILNETGHNFAIYKGTDLTNMKDLEERLNEVPWFYDIKNFDEINDVVNFPHTRIRNDKPKVANRFIESVEIVYPNCDKRTSNKVNFKPGLNSIIGRRGTGKSFLATNIKKAIDSGNDSFSVVKNKMETKFIVNYRDGLTIKGEYRVLEQNILSSTINKYLKRMYEIDKGRNWKDSVGWDDIGVDIKEMEQNFIDVKKCIKNIVNSFSRLFDNNVTEVSNMEQKKCDEYSLKYLERVTDVLSTNNNEYQINLLSKDKEELSKIVEGSISPWLLHHLTALLNKLKKIEQDNRYKKNEKINTFKSIIKKVKNEIDSSESGSSAVIDQDNPAIICKNIINISNTKIRIENYFKGAMKNYEKFKVEEYHPIIKDPFVKPLGEEFENFKLEKTFRIIKSTDRESFIESLLLAKYVKPPKPQTIHKNLSIKNICGFNSKERESGIQFFETKEIYYIDEVSLDGKSVGEQHQVFINSVFSKDFDVLILDQPDDDLDSITIYEQIIKRLNLWGFEKQIIIITHDPKIVINSDSQSIILANFNGDDRFGVDHYRNINKEDIIDNIHEILDAKKDFPRIRYKKYGGYNGN